jgi:hypothetical protein
MKKFEVTMKTSVGGLFTHTFEAETEQEAMQKAENKFGKWYGFKIITIKEA